MTATASEPGGLHSSQDLSQDDLENIYSGGDCYQLALWIHNSDPDRFELWEATSRLQDGQLVDDSISEHWFVKDKHRNVFIDVYGDSGQTPESVLAQWPAFEGDETIEYNHWSNVSAARKRMLEQFSSKYEKAFSGPWEENAKYVSERLNLIKPS